MELRNYGSRIKYQHRVKGFNMRLDTLQAAILDLKLKYLDEWNQKRMGIAKKYYERLSNVPEVRLLEDSNEGACVFHLYVIRTKDRDKLKEYLSKCPTA